jgi:hypothetical protein
MATRVVIGDPGHWALEHPNAIRPSDIHHSIGLGAAPGILLVMLLMVMMPLREGNRPPLRLPINVPNTHTR